MTARTNFIIMTEIQKAKKEIKILDLQSSGVVVVTRHELKKNSHSEHIRC